MIYDLLFYFMMTLSSLHLCEFIWNDDQSEIVTWPPWRLAESVVCFLLVLLLAMVDLRIWYLELLSKVLEVETVGAEGVTVELDSLTRWTREPVISFFRPSSNEFSSRKLSYHTELDNLCTVVNHLPNHLMHQSYKWARNHLNNTW